MEHIEKTDSLAEPANASLLERMFKIEAHGSSVKTELIAGLTTFVTMAYIIFVNPAIMADAGLDHGAAFVATCIGAALGCFLMGFYANWPGARNGVERFLHLHCCRRHGIRLGSCTGCCVPLWRSFRHHEFVQNTRMVAGQYPDEPEVRDGCRGRAVPWSDWS